MVISARKVNNLEKSNMVIPTYRVLNNHEVQGIQSDRYKYYSKTMEHHLYFLVKKIFNQIKGNFDISFCNSRDKHLIEKINEIINILEQEVDFSITTKYLWCDANCFDLISDNSYSNKYNHRENVIERVDTTIYSGGYGLKNMWLEVFDILTYCYDIHIISPNLLIDYFNELKKLLEIYGNDSLKCSKLEAGKVLLRSSMPIQVSDSITVDKSNELAIVLNDINNNHLYKNELIHIDDVLKRYEMSRKLVMKKLKK